MLVCLGHGVECGPVLEPLELALVEGVAQFAVPRLTVLGVNLHGYRLADGEFGA